MNQVFVKMIAECLGANLRMETKGTAADIIVIPVMIVRQMHGVISLRIQVFVGSAEMILQEEGMT